MPLKLISGDGILMPISETDAYELLKANAIRPALFKNLKKE